MLIASWNVNSVKARLDRLVPWLQRRAPDVVCLQELKTEQPGFPFDALAELGYEAAVCGQKTYNGVAVLSRVGLDDVRIGWDGYWDDPQARLVEATTAGVRVVSAYVPNGSEVGSDKFVYKLAWLDKLQAYVRERMRADDKIALCGDFNVAPRNEDVANPDAWAESVLCAQQVRERFDALIAWGFVDAFRHRHPEVQAYSWWDYRRLGFPKNDGLRIDHVLLTAPLRDVIVDAAMDRDERKGKKPSDHCPVCVELDL